MAAAKIGVSQTLHDSRPPSFSRRRLSLATSSSVRSRGAGQSATSVAEFDLLYMSYSTGPNAWWKFIRLSPYPFSRPVRQPQSLILQSDHLVNCEQEIGDYLRNPEKFTHQTTIASCLRWCHDMGLLLGIWAGSLRTALVLISPLFVPAATTPLDAIAGKHSYAFGAAANLLSSRQYDADRLLATCRRTSGRHGQMISAACAQFGEWRWLRPG
jgi:hypothetical protein